MLPAAGPQTARACGWSACWATLRWRGLTLSSCWTPLTPATRRTTSGAFPCTPTGALRPLPTLQPAGFTDKDSLGNAGSIRDGGCQWMTAGSGILHEEMPRASERMLGLQLWVNLPRRDKMAPPQYRDITADQVPVLEEDAARVAVVAGRYNEVDGAARGAYVAVRFLDVTLRPGKTWSVAAPPEDTLFAYFMEGEANLVPAGTPLLARHAYLLGGGDTAAFTGGPEGARLVLVSGAPLHEPVAWGGPIVMNTEAELRQAYQELEDGSFIRHAAPALRLP